MNNQIGQLVVFLPLVYEWAEKTEAIWLKEGVPLNEAQLQDARRAGVTHPEKIRLVQVDTLPHPDNEELMFVARQVGFYGPDSVALNLGYGICVCSRKWNDRLTLAHEFVHVGQHERLQGMRPFLAEYLRQSFDPGFPFGQLEQYATHIARDICKVSGSGRLPKVPPQS